MTASQKTTATMIDELITACIRCWMAQETLMNEKLSEQERFKAALLAQQTNKRRSDLMRAIDERLGEGAFAGMAKSYGK